MTIRIRNARSRKFEILAALDAADRITQRDKDVVKRILSGETYRAVAPDFGIGPERVRGICFGTFQKLGFNL
jgi:FixJ family two-component response regulator